MTVKRRRSGVRVEWTWHWRSVAAVVYLAICFTDFLAMPVYREWSYSRMSVSQMVQEARRMPNAQAQIETLRILKEDRPWSPLTNEIFHLAFGAILGVSALPANRRKPTDDDSADDTEKEPVV